MALISCTYVLFFILAFVADRLPLIKIMRKISALGKVSLETIGSTHIPDTEKQKILLANSGTIFKQSLIMIALVLLVLGIGFLLTLGADVLGIVKRPILFDYLDSATGIIISVVSFGSYFLLKKIYARARL